MKLYIYKLVWLDRLSRLSKRRRKNAIFLVNIFQKVPKIAFLGLFFQIFACGAEILAKTGSL